ncbi:MAG: sulfatase-like hydrolase/transferase [Hyphomicrobiaceae bacterium]|nr:sulfatase-like hydrolase/transferase [Hyphomicrobiaceae bacterium]
MALRTAAAHVYPALTAAALLTFIIYLIRHENAYALMPIETLANTGILVAVILLLSRRVQFSILLGVALACVIVVVSHMMFEFLATPLHAYDIWFYLSSKDTIRFLISGYTYYALLLALGLVFLGIVGAYGWRADHVKVSLGQAAVALMAAIAAAWLASAGPYRGIYTAMEDYPLTVFYHTIGDAVAIVERGPLLDASQPKAPLRNPFHLGGPCVVARSAPHVILIHQESGFPPSLFPSITYDRALDPYFVSFDGKVHKLGVETYGGGSWLTEFSLLSGISTYSFGRAGRFAQALMRGRIKESVPQSFARCGYQTATFYTMRSNFVGSGPFYKSIGFKDFFDADAQGAKSYFERDSFYYGNVIKYLVNTFKTSPAQRVLVYVLTNATHHPYNYKMSPEIDVPQPENKNSADMNEYLRRMMIAKWDYDAFKSELAKRFPREKFVIVRYGDHQPLITREVPESERLLPPSTSARGSRPAKLVTYYVVDAIGYTPPELPDFDILDVPYLSSIIARSAHLPLTDSHLARLSLMKLCQGHYFFCKRRAAVLDFHRRLLDAKLIDVN